MRDSAVLLALACVVCGGAGAEVVIDRIDRFVAHVSTVPANKGERVGLFVREKIGRALAAELEAGGSADGRVVLFVHGVSVPSVPDFDLDFRDYSWMDYLAAAGFDTFAMDHTGYGYSPRPRMSDPCALAERDRALVDQSLLAGDCGHTPDGLLTSSATDWDEIDTVVDHIRALRGVGRVSLVGWSLGGLRTGGYAARHADKIDRLVLFAPVYQRSSPDGPPRSYPAAGPPMTLQTRTALMNDRWESNVACEGQVQPGIRERVWQTIMSHDAYGSVWARPDGVMRVRTASYWGWNAAAAGRISTPTLILIGEQDGLLPGAEALYADIAGTANRVIVRMDCATHFAVWEASQYKFMHEASKEWLMHGRFRGHARGEFEVGFGGGPRE